MMEGTTDSLRALATDWSLAADESLLNVLKTTHQKIVSKCQEVNTKMEEMVSALDDASINLQNVNNKFMALSNSQFIESRVYDDDGDLNNEEKPVTPPPQPEPVDQLTLLKQSLIILDRAHETAEIIDESETDESDVEISMVVLKPRDAYAHRPLPYIIGSQSWKNKWHAGLVIDESDTDSSTSRQNINVEQYSESDDDIYTDTEKMMPQNFTTNISNSSSSLHSTPMDPPEKKTPAAVAAELQARLGNVPPPTLVHAEPDELPPPSTNRTVYRPQKPVTSTIFFDEPPPLDHQYPEADSQEEDDIFAEINKNQPYNNYTGQNNVDDLFGTITGEYSDSSKRKVKTSAKQKTTLFDEEQEPELFVEKPKNIPKETQSSRAETNESSSKKPVGGKSLFGSNKGTESIGAAILQRNRRKSSSSESDGGKNTIKNDAADENSSNSDDDSEINNANAIFDNLFAKAKQAEQKLMNPAKFDKPFINKPEPVKGNSQSVKEKTPLVKEKAQLVKEKTPLATEKAQTVKEKPKPKVNDIFSDSIFDDIDDIFNDIKIPSKEANKNAKSIFDDDDLFADVTKNDTKVVKNVETNSKATTSHNKSIFDSDDDLFGDVKTKNESNTKETVKIESQSKTTKENNDNIKDMKPMDKEPIFSSPESKEKKPKIQTKSIFDSDSDDEIFSSGKTKTPVPKEQTNNSINVNTETEAFYKEHKDTKHKENLKFSEKQVFQSPSLFEEDEIDNLFINANKVKEKTLEINHTDETIPEYLPDLKQVSKKDLETDYDDNKHTSEITQKNTHVNIENPEIIDPNVSKSNKVETESALLDNLEEDLFTKPLPSAPRKTEEPVSTDDIIETSQEIDVQGNKSSIGVTVKSKIEEQDRKENTETEYIKTETQDETEKFKIYEHQPETSEPAKVNEALIPEQKPVIFSSAFDDIFSEPPAFEKTKEPKKTTNVNALFEDDSDDESLFFKKNDNVSDDKPEIFSPSADFGIFSDEPPDLDVDFTSKGIKNNIDDDLFSSVPKAAKPTLIRNEPPEVDDWNDDVSNDKTTKKIGKPENTAVKFDNELFGASNISNVKEATSVDVPSLANNINIPDDDDALFSKTPKVLDTTQKETTEITKDIDQVDEIVKTNDLAETKKIGKINTKNFNINVQALVPGASPKKIAKERTNDDKIDINNTSNEEFIRNVEQNTDVDNTEPVIVKSITFESKPESGVLDNKLSKQRAKIQVKRRPSTRRARHEAVRKSVINIDDDTDNSSSIDDPTPNNHEQLVKETKSTSNVNTQDTVEKNVLIDTVKGENPKTEDLIEQNITENINKPTPSQNKINIHDEITRHLISNKSTDEIDSITEIEKGNDDLLNAAGQLSPRSTTKVKYILNDEDIFKTNDNSPTKEAGNEKTDEEDIFKTANNSSEIETNNEKEDCKPTQDQKKNTYTSKEVSKPAQPKAKSLFDLSDDEDELFGKTTKKKVEVKSKLFDSDSEDDLFSGKKDKKMKAKVKGSLFSDDDDDDLFGVKTKTVAAKAETSKIPSKSATSKNFAKSSEATEIAFEDPLSMLDDD